MFLWFRSMTTQRLFCRYNIETHLTSLLKDNWKIGKNERYVHIFERYVFPYLRKTCSISSTAQPSIVSAVRCVSVPPVNRGGAMGLGLLEITGYRETQEPRVAVTLEVKAESNRTFDYGPATQWLGCVPYPGLLRHP